MKFNKILVPLDGSELSEKALEHAISIAEANSSKLILVRVMDPGSQISGEFSVTAYSRQIEEMESETEGYVAQQAEKLSNRGIQTEAVVQVGKPALRIVKAAEEREVDLIVMSSHGRSGIRRWFLGSVAEEVLRHSSIPILMLPLGKTEES